MEVLIGMTIENVVHKCCPEICDMESARIKLNKYNERWQAMTNEHRYP